MEGGAGELTATVVITTRNRREELKRALSSVLVQAARPEIIVLDDGSTDGTSAMVAAEFPTVRLIRFEEAKGYIVGRNHAARLASGEVIFSIDDDAVYSSPETIARVLPVFADPCVGAAAMPYIDVHYGPETKQAAEDGEPRVVQQFRGTAHAVRRAAFLEVGGYREQLFQQDEEADLGLRLLDRGYLTVAAPAPPILHYESPRRDHRRIIRYARRNDLLVIWWNYPRAELLPAFWTALLNGLRTGKHRRILLYTIRSMLLGLAALPRYSRLRHPIRPGPFALWKSLEAGRSLPKAEALRILASGNSAPVKVEAPSL
jgi:GT2 family glycosyltransferase